jgi:hypothetical protein
MSPPSAAPRSSEAWWTPSRALSPPHTPTLNAFIAPDGSVGLNWESVSTTDGFRVLRSYNGKDFDPIGEVSGTRNFSFSDATPRRGETCFYRLEAYNAAGSTPSNTAVVRLSTYQTLPRSPSPRR